MLNTLFLLNVFNIFGLSKDLWPPCQSEINCDMFVQYVKPKEALPYSFRVRKIKASQYCLALERCKAINGPLL